MPDNCILSRIVSPDSTTRFTDAKNGRIADQTDEWESFELAVIADGLAERCIAKGHMQARIHSENGIGHACEDRFPACEVGVQAIDRVRRHQFVIVAGQLPANRRSENSVSHAIDVNRTIRL
jgi:hypothetical protein